MKNLEIHLDSRPTGLPDESTFRFVESDVPDPAGGQLLVRNIYMSVDPYMRNRMYDRKSYQPPYKLGETMEGGAIGRVINSRNDNFKEGDFVLSNQGWRRYFLSNGRRLRKVDPNLAPLSTYLGVMGMPGWTAYVGLLDIGKPDAGETVVVSAAGGAVGSVACQIARIKGCQVVGSAGSDAKVTWLREELGLSGAYNYKSVPSHRAAMRRLCPDGIDICFENVGGEHLEAAISRMNDFGRIVLCGMIAYYNAPEPFPGPRNLSLAVTKRLTLQGFIIIDHRDRLADFYRDMAAWIADGQIKWRETIVEGLENAPQAFLGLFKGQNIGKMLVRIDSE
jgi:NADPH-dependent curcumin reductase CurA